MTHGESHSGAVARNLRQEAAPAQVFRLRVRNAVGTTADCLEEAASESDALRKVLARGERVLAIERVAEGAHSSATPATGRFPLLLFSQELLTLLDAGLHLNEALTTLAAKEKQPHVRLILQRVLHALAEGRNFSDVLGDAPQHFPEVYVATVRASERTGDLPRALARYIAYQLQFEQLRKKLISASIYPAMLLGVGGFVALFLLGYVVPKFASVYESSGREMPWLSRVMLDMGRILHAHGSAALMILVGLVLLGAVAARSAVVKRWAIDQLLSMPGLARVSQEFRLARFYRAVSLLLASGIPLPRAMPMVAGLLSGEQQQRLSKARRLVDEGHAFSAALVSCNLAGPVAESLIKVGERSGQLAEMLERTAGFHDEEFSRWVDWASRLLEPILMTVIGGVIGVVVVLMYLPIFDLAGSLQ